MQKANVSLVSQVLLFGPLNGVVPNRGKTFFLHAVLLEPIFPAFGNLSTVVIRRTTLGILVGKKDLRGFDFVTNSDAQISQGDCGCFDETVCQDFRQNYLSHMMMHIRIVSGLFPDCCQRPGRRHSEEQLVTGWIPRDHAPHGRITPPTRGLAVPRGKGMVCGVTRNYLRPADLDCLRTVLSPR